jgi:hypothetical protein
MASICTRSSAKHTVQPFDPYCMASRHFPNSSRASVGKHPYLSYGKKHNWFGCYNGWGCFASIILLYNALVEDTMAKLKYVLCSLCWFFNLSFILYFVPCVRFHCLSAILSEYGCSWNPWTVSGNYICLCRTPINCLSLHSMFFGWCYLTTIYLTRRHIRKFRYYGIYFKTHSTWKMVMWFVRLS